MKPLRYEPKDSSLGSSVDGWRRRTAYGNQHQSVRASRMAQSDEERVRLRARAWLASPDESRTALVRAAYRVELALTGLSVAIVVCVRVRGRVFFALHSQAALPLVGALSSCDRSRSSSWDASRCAEHGLASPSLDTAAEKWSIRNRTKTECDEERARSADRRRRSHG